MHWLMPFHHISSKVFLLETPGETLEMLNIVTLILSETCDMFSIIFNMFSSEQGVSLLISFLKRVVLDPEVAAQYHLSEAEFQEMQENNEESWTNCFMELKPSGVLREINNEDPLKKPLDKRFFLKQKRALGGMFCGNRKRKKLHLQR